jgi:hypothetical protein
MKAVQKLGATVVLTFLLALSAFAGQIETPPCAAPVPGQIETPPCAITPGDIDTPGFTSPAPASLATPRVASSETWFAEIAADLFLNFLPLY